MPRPLVGDDDCRVPDRLRLSACAEAGVRRGRGYTQVSCRLRRVRLEAAGFFGSLRSAIAS
jgi:hypothetical protein